MSASLLSRWLSAQLMPPAQRSWATLRLEETPRQEQGFSPSPHGEASLPDRALSLTFPWHFSYSTWFLMSLSPRFQVTVRIVTINFRKKKLSILFNSFGILLFCLFCLVLFSQRRTDTALQI
jgi:hypothetical protein